MSKLRAALLKPATIGNRNALLLYCSMNEPFIIPLVYKGEEIEVSAKLLRVGYTEQFHVNLQGVPLIIEFDEERNLRVINPSAENENSIDKGLLEELIATITKLRS